MNIIIFGAGGQAKETIDLIEKNIDGKIIGLVDQTGNKIFGYPYLGKDNDIDNIIKKYSATHFYVAIGDLEIRSKLYLSLKAKLQPLSIIDKDARVSKHSKIGEHTIVYPGVVVSADVEVGDDVFVNTNAAISHEVKIGNHININPGANIAGKVTIGDFSTIGIGASIREKINIAPHTFVGAGAVVVKDTEGNNIYVGVPASKVN